MSELIPFKNIHINKKVILFGPGSSLNDFNDVFGKDYFRAALSGVILHEEIQNKINYWIWAGDLVEGDNSSRTYDRIIDIIPKLNKNITKFVNCWTNNSITGICNKQTQIHPDLAKKYNFIRYNQISINYGDGSDEVSWYKDLSSYCSGVSAYSACFAAMQILLYMGFKEIILVGFDCSGNHSYKKIFSDDFCGWNNDLTTNLIKRWKLFKIWSEKEYPDVSIKVINPIGLKNVFEEYNY